jgi:hypothetical protein
MFEKAGNVRLAGYTGTNSSDLHIAVSPINHIGIMGVGSWSSNKKNEGDKPDSSAEYTHSHRYLEGAVGYYFSPIPLQGDILKIEIFAGYGYGTANGSLDTGEKNIIGIIVPTTQVEADYQQYYLQLNAGINNFDLNRVANENSKPKLEYGTVFRVSQTRYSNFKKNGVTLKLNPMEASFIQIGFWGSIGGTGTGLTIQTGWLYAISNDETRPAYSPLFISVGLRLGFW